MKNVQIYIIALVYELFDNLSYSELITFFNRNTIIFFW